MQSYYNTQTLSVKSILDMPSVSTKWSTDKSVCLQEGESRIKDLRLKNRQVLTAFQELF